MSAREFFAGLLTEIRVATAERLAPLTVTQPMADALHALAKLEWSETACVRRVEQAALLAAYGINDHELHGVLRLAARGELWRALDSVRDRETTRTVMTTYVCDCGSYLSFTEQTQPHTCSFCGRTVTDEVPREP